MPGAESNAATFRRLQAEDFFKNETFENLDLRGVDLSGREFCGCTFEKCNLDESRWHRSKIEDCDFRSCDLDRVVFQATALRGVRFEKSKMMGVDWSDVSPYPEVTFEDCKLRYSSFTGLGLRKASFRRCSAVEASFMEVDLTDADFSGTDLAGCIFEKCTLTRTDFREAKGLFLDPSRNRLKETGVPVDTAIALARSLGMSVAGDNR